MAMPINAIANPIYQPAMRIIQSISQANVGQSIVLTITTTFNHQYNTGLIVRLTIPDGFGMTEADQLTSPIVVTGPTIFTFIVNPIIPLSPFVIPVTFPDDYQAAQVVPVGELTAFLNSATVNVLPLT